MNKQDHKTKDFLEKIDLLISRGIIKNHAEIVSVLNWNKSVMSSVKNGSLSVPQHIYNKFKEVYSDKFTKNPDPLDQDFRSKYLALIEAAYTERVELLQKVDANLALLPGSMNKLTGLILDGQEMLMKKMSDELSQKFEILNQKLDAIAATGVHKKTVQKGKQA
jgi:hypothetical protein